jgi:hypothetical protein
MTWGDIADTSLGLPYWLLPEFVPHVRFAQELREKMYSACVES